MNRTSLLPITLLGGFLLLGCNGPKTGESDTEPMKKCSTHTACTAGYKCDFGGANPSDPTAVGVCVYQKCGLTELCKKPQPCLPDKETAMCDANDNDKFCGCVSPNSEDVPTTPTTTAGDKP